MNKMFTIFALLCVISSHAQSLAVDSVILNVEIYTPVAYVDANHKYYGCQLNIDCLNLDILFRNTSVNKAAHSISFDAYINANYGPPGLDTIGSNFFQIFTAVPHRERLRNKHLIASVRNDSVKTAPGVIVWVKAGHVFAKLHYKRKERLYILSGSRYKLVEYDLPMLFNRKNRNSYP